MVSIYNNNNLKAIHIEPKSVTCNIVVMGTYLFNQLICLLLIDAISFDSYRIKSLINTWMMENTLIDAIK